MGKSWIPKIWGPIFSSFSNFSRFSRLLPRSFGGSQFWAIQILLFLDCRNLAQRAKLGLGSTYLLKSANL
jgi:hypothetical protein